MGNPTNSSLPAFRGNTVGIDIDNVSYIKVKNLKTTNNYMGVDIDAPINVVYLENIFSSIKPLSMKTGRCF